MITADTITDEQIRELRTAVLNDEHCYTVARDVLACDAALRYEAGARARCAQLLNARNAKKVQP